MEQIVKFDEHGDGVITGELVRCGECKYWKVYKNDCGWGLCEKHDIDHPCHDDWFCADGEREVQE